MLRMQFASPSFVNAPDISASAAHFHLPPETVAAARVRLPAPESALHPRHARAPGQRASRINAFSHYAGIADTREPLLAAASCVRRGDDASDAVKSAISLPAFPAPALSRLSHDPPPPLPVCAGCGHLDGLGACNGVSSHSALTTMVKTKLAISQASDHERLHLKDNHKPMKTYKPYAENPALKVLLHSTDSHRITTYI